MVVFVLCALEAFFEPVVLVLFFLVLLETPWVLRVERLLPAVLVLYPVEGR